MGTHPIFESDFDCLTEKMMRSRVLSVLGRRTKATLPELPYEYHALEPYISADIMELHHSKHHATYVNNLNVANAIKFNGGGHVNHTIFWQNMSPNGGGEPEGALAEAIARDFGSFAAFKANMSQATVAVQGS